jgi:hypothetical protein
MKKSIHYVLILDQSGSMLHLKDEVVNSFNQQLRFIKKLKAENPEVDIKITLCKFNDDIEFIYDKIEVSDLKKMKSKDYTPCLCTALYDAIGICFNKISGDINPDGKAFLLIFTDGLENASKIFTADDINEILQSAEKRGWEIKFFCRYEDQAFYQDKIRIRQKSFVHLQMDEEGLNNMVCEANSVLCRLAEIDSDKEDSTTNK